MNIGQLMRGFLGEPQAGESKTLELRAGQVVRGVVLQVLEGQDAIVQINGLQVRAKLEMPLMPGQATAMQVQPETAGGMIVLKPVDGAAMPEETLRELAKSLGLPETKWAMELIRDMKQSGFAINRELGAALAKALAAAPPGVNSELFMQAAAMAFKRGLPMTGTTIGALQQAMFGKPAHELLEGLRAQLQAFTAASGGAGAAAASPAATAPPVSTGAAAAAGRLLALLAEGAPLLRAAGEATAAQTPAAGASGGRGEAGTLAAGQPAAGALAGSGPGSAVSTPGAAAAGGAGAAAGAAHAASSAAAAGASAGSAASGASAGNAAAAAGSGAVAPPGAAADQAGGWVGQLMKWLGVDHERQLARGAAAAPSGAGQPGGAPANAGNAAGLAGNAAAGAAAGAAEGLAQQEAARAAGSPPQAGPALAASGGQAPGQERAAVLPGGGLADLPPAADAAGRPAAAAHESLKSALLTLLASDDVPPALREVSQQLLQHVTGQQLLLASERNGAVLSHLTMFIPFEGESGEQTASVHIQTRRGRKGELDASNCRLLFDLQMKRLGDTLVDVHVVDKIVSLTIWNDHPAMGMLLETTREEVVGALGQAGYQLSALRTSPLPDRAAAQSDQSGKPTNSEQKQIQPPSLSTFSPRPYKGVDLRA
ncbi:DNA ligase [Paenibacillaceae bacterium]|nr:DNA ligase [Paenibacillaceae bacterium]